jgi:hypothetical protein
MALFQAGYFKLLPTELRSEIFHHLESVIFLNTSEFMDSLDENNPDSDVFEFDKDRLLQFIVEIPVPGQYAADNINFYCTVDVQRLCAFFENILEDELEFIDTDKLILAKVVDYDLTDDNIMSAIVGDLFNINRSNCVYISMDNDLIVFTCYDADQMEGRPIYTLTQLQTEILLYKLVQFYNDVSKGNIEEIWHLY